MTADLSRNAGSLSRQKSPDLSIEALCSCCLPSWSGQVLRRSEAEEVPLRDPAVKSVRWTLLGRKKPRSCDRGVVFALPTFLGRPGIVLALRNMPVACFSKKKPPTFVGGLVFTLPTFLGRPSVVLPSKVSGGHF